VSLESIITLAKVLSASSLLLLLWILRDWWRRKEFPSAAYGGIELPGRRIRWLWLLVLIGGCAVGAAEDPIVTAHGLQETEREYTGRSRSYTLTLPFIHYAREEARGDTGLVVIQTETGLQIPKAFLVAMAAYLALVMWWHPGRGWSRRFLFGRRHKKTNPATSPGQEPSDEQRASDTKEEI
jgi:hypothetical protein